MKLHTQINEIMKFIMKLYTQIIYTQKTRKFLYIQ